MAEAKKEKGVAGLKRKFYKVDGDRISRERANCPKCGPGVFLARHANRVSCGRCGYTEFAKKWPGPRPCSGGCFKPPDHSPSSPRRLVWIDFQAPDLVTWVQIPTRASQSPNLGAMRGLRRRA